MTTTNTTVSHVETIGNGYTLPTPEIISQIGVSPKITSEFANSHPVCDKNSKFLHYGALVYPKRYAVSNELKNLAIREYDRMKNEIIANIGNKLVFVGMGMSYEARYNDDPCNHRMRTEILAPNGNKYFIEVGTWGAENTHFHHVIDRTQQAEYEEKQSIYYDKIISLGGFNAVSKEHPARINYDKYSSQPYHWFKREEWEGKRMKYTKSNILAIVNSLFGCNFSEIEIHEYFINTQDYISTSPKK